MGLFSKIGLGIYYRIRRMKKALKNWRRFGVIIFGSILVASTLMPTGVLADDLRVEIYKGNQALSSMTINAGSTQQFTAKAFLGTTEVTNSTSFTWSMNGQYPASSVGSISSSGLYTAGNQAGFYSGAIKLVGTYSSQSDLDTVSVTINSVTPPPPPPTKVLDRVEIIYNNQAISSFTIDAGANKQFSPKAYATDDSDITADTAFTWSMSGSWTATQVGTVTQSGLYTAGTHAGNHSGALRLVGTYSSQSDLDTVSVTINSVTPPPPPPTKVLDRVEIIYNNQAISSFTIDAGANKQFSPKAYATDDSDITADTAFTWSMNGTWTAAQVGTVTQSGLYTAGTHAGNHSGALRLVGTYSSQSDLDTVSVTINSVTPPPTKTWTLGVSPASDVLTLTGSSVSRDFDFVATYNDGSGNVTLTSVNWQVIHPGQFSAGGSINTNGLYTATHTGYDTIKLTASDGTTTKEAWASVSVIAGPQPEEPYLAYVQVTPHPWMMDMNDTKLFDATSYDQNDDVISGSLVSYTWSVINGGGSINSTSGLFTAGSTAGTFDHTARVKAIYQGNTRYGYATVIVNPIYTQAVLDRVEILPPSVTINRYNSFDFSAYAYDTNDNQMFSGVTYTWEVISGPGSVNQNGLYTATNSTNAATVQVEARQGGIRVYDTATVYITGSGGCTSILDRVELTPSTGYVNTGNSIDFDALAYDTAGCLVSADLWFSVSNDSNSYINQSGYFTARYNTGTFNDLVRVRAYRDGREVYDWATVVISTGVTPPPTSNYYVDASLRAMDETTGSAYQANEGDTILYTLRLTNNRTNSLTGVTVTMDVPEYTTFVSASSQSGAPMISGRTITWNAGGLYVGESKTMWVRVRVNGSVPTYAVIRGKAWVRADQLSGGFWVYSNDLPVNGTGPAPIEPLVPTGAMEWILAAMTALLATILTRQLMHTRKLLAQK